MHPPSTKSRNKSSNKLPFTVESMKQYEPFQQLEAKVKAKICELLTSGEVSPKGNIKRPPNSFILYRRDRLSELKNYMESSPGSISKLKPSMVKSEWNESDVEKAEYSRLARHKQQEHNAKFPGYKYRPIPERKWRAINENGRKKWFFESLSLVSTNILGANSGTQPYDIDIDEWIRDPANHKYVNSQILDEVLSNAKSTTRTPPGSRSCSAIQTIANYSSQNVTQPYNNADVNNHNIPYEYVNATVPLLPGDIACPQSLPLAQSPSPRSTTIISFIGSPLLYSEASVTPFTEEAHELSQDDPSSSRSISASFYKPNTTQNEVGFITTGGGSEDFTNHTVLVADELAMSDVPVEQDLWNINNLEIYIPYTQGIVRGSETTFDYTSLSLPSDQDGVFSQDLTNSNGELYNYSELMNEFLDPSVLEDMDES